MARIQVAQGVMSSGDVVLVQLKGYGDSESMRAPTCSTTEAEAEHTKVERRSVRWAIAGPEEKLDPFGVRKQKTRPIPVFPGVERSRSGYTPVQWEALTHDPVQQTKYDAKSGERSDR